MKSRWVLTALLVAAFVAPQTGCRTAAFPKPDLSKLAFWKNDDRVAALPPPPARHFDPLEVEIEDPGTEMAGNPTGDASLGGPGLGLEPRVDNQVAPAGRIEEGKPLRTPYSLDPSSSNSASNNAFDLDTSQIQSQSSTNVQQQQFLQAMDSTEPAKVGGGAFEGFAQPMADAARDTKEQFQAFAEQSLDQGSQLIQQQRQQFSQQLDQSAQNLSQGLDQYKQQAQNQIDSLAQSAGDAVRSFNPLQPLPTPDSGMGSSQAGDSLKAQMQDARQEIARLKQQVAQQESGAINSGRQTGPLTERPGASFETDNSSFVPAGNTGMSTESESTPGYPSTPHNEFSKSSLGAPSGGSFEGSMVGFQSAPNDSGGVAHAAAQQALQPLDQPHQAQLIPNHTEVSEVPEAILIGEGNYAPGSLNTLRR